MSEGVPIQKPECSRDKCFKSRQSLLRRTVTTELQCCRSPPYIKLRTTSSAVAELEFVVFF